MLNTNPADIKHWTEKGFEEKEARTKAGEAALLMNKRKELFIDKKTGEYDHPQYVEAIEKLRAEKPSAKTEAKKAEQPKAKPAASKPVEKPVNDKTIKEVKE